MGISNTAEDREAFEAQLDTVVMASKGDDDNDIWIGSVLGCDCNFITDVEFKEMVNRDSGAKDECLVCKVDEFGDYIVTDKQILEDLNERY